MTLSNYIAVYVPSTVAGNEPAPQNLIDSAIETVATAFAKRFGGFTVTDGQGGWFSDEHGLITEDVKIVKAFYADDTDDAEAFAVRFAVNLKELFEQEAVSVEHNGALILV